MSEALSSQESNVQKDIDRRCEKIDKLLKSQNTKIRNVHMKCKLWLNEINLIIRDALKLRRSSRSTRLLQSLTTQINNLRKIRFLIKAMASHKPGQKRNERLSWENMEVAFKSRIRNGVIINKCHIDINDFFNDAFYIFKSQITNVLKLFNIIKVNCCFCGEYIIKKESVECLDVKYFNTRNDLIDVSTDLVEWFNTIVISRILSKMEEFQERDSGWALDKIISLEVNINKFEMGVGASSYIPLPREIATKKACLNIKNADEACFYWCVVAALKPVKFNYNSVSSYRDYKRVLKTEGLSVPMPIYQIPKFEALNSDISVNIYKLEMTTIDNKRIFKTVPARITKEKREKHVNLLLIENYYNDDDDDNNSSRIENQYHYVLIKDLSRLVRSQLTKHKGKIYICDKCLNYFSTEQRLDKHSTLCGKNNSTVQISFPSDDYVEFKNFVHKQETPFIVYADIESILEDLEDSSSHTKTKIYQKHIPCSAAFYFKCSFDDQLSFFKSRRSVDCINWFSKEMAKLSQLVQSKLSTILPAQLELNKNMSQECHICEKMFVKTDKIVQDHDHFTGKIRGPAHNECNLNYKKKFVVPVVFHNLSAYDCHFIIKKFASEHRVNILPVNKETYISFTRFDHVTQISLRFIDSYRFLAASLSDLVSTVPQEDFEILQKEFSSCESANLQLLMRKGVFCYDYINCMERLNEQELPSQSNFYSKLNDEPLSDEDYSHARAIWQTFSIKTLGEYSDLYLKTDVLLLADVFENFRKNSRNLYGLDPAWYYTLPGYTWDCMLKYTNCKLKLLKELDQIEFIEAGMRGGISVCSNRYSEANNKYMTQFDRTKESKYLLYLDVNNLYGWAMTQFLPYDNFEWMKKVEGFDVTLIEDDSPVGYILEVDLEYPQELHDLHKDFPFCAEHATPINSKQSKLIGTLHNKRNYVIHYRNLKQSLQHSLRLTKIHRILKFNQSAWLKPYIDFNTNLRSTATNDFSKNIFKLMNNAVFGKTMENIRKHRIVKILNKWDSRYGAKNLISNAEFCSRTILDENCVLVEMKKTSLVFNKPIYIGFSILDLSKTVMYDFHYDFMLKQISLEKCKLLYTDTDSFIYEILCEDVYKQVIKSNPTKFDTSDYPPDNVYDIPRLNKKVVGLMKDEANGKIMTHFVGLRSKMYCYQIDNDINRCVKKAKGVRYNVVKNKITFNDYVECLKFGVNKEVEQKRIHSSKHQVYSIVQNKLGLSRLDDKRCLIEDSFDTLPWGHYKIDTGK